VDICSIGGNAATNAGGLCCVKYGVTSDYVLGMEVVLADGSVCRLGSRLSKDVAGLSLTKLFVGSEGTLGVITELTLRRLPQPAVAGTVVASFASLEHAARAVVAITATFRPTMLELMDRATVNAVEDRLRMGLDRSAGALLIAQADAGADLETLAGVCRAHEATEVFHTNDPDEGDLFVHVRRSALPALEAQGSVLLEDVGVPMARLPELVERIQAKAVDWGVTIAVIAHAGDGNTHPVIVFDPEDEAQSRRARAAFEAVMGLALELGGTITGEHGVGRLKRGWLASQLGKATMTLNWRIKQALDPGNILNPGALFDPSVQC
jgi:glycolate oxidase